MRSSNPDVTRHINLQSNPQMVHAGTRMKAIARSVAAVNSMRSVLGAIPLAAGLVFAFGGSPVHAEEGGSRAQALEEVIVTARRKEETVQTTPISLTAITPAQMAASGIKEIRDLTATVPGVNFAASGAPNNTLFSMRGRSKGTIGIAQPSVTTYINEVPVNNWGASIPTYDLASIQVLKGPQGTLFGRNSTTGAILVSTAEPENQLGGYVSALAGDYNWRQYEGALNLPIVEDKVALRIAAQVARRDGYTENMSIPGRDMDDMHRDNYRASLKLTPVDWLTNVTVYESNDVNEVLGSVLYSYNPNPALPVNALAPIVGSSAAAWARQDAAGPRKAWTDLRTKADGELTSANNTTTLDFDGVTVKNIIGYRTVSFHNVGDIDGTDLAILNSDTVVNYKQITEELQVSGSTLDETLDYVAGLFYLKSEPDGNNRLSLQQFAFPGTPMTSKNLTSFGPLKPFLGAVGNGDYYEETSKAVYGQITYKLGALSDSLEKFSVDVGARYTKDEQDVCDAAVQFLADPAVTEGQCKSLSSPLYSKQSTDFSRATWQVGLNYAATDHLFLYAVTRSGYRGGGINTPTFAGKLTPYQTFDPEEVQDFEVGSKLDFSAGDLLGRWNVALFQSNFDKVQAGISGSNLDGDGNPINDPSNLTFYANVGKATVKGVETELTVSPINNLELSFTGAYLEKEMDSFDLPAGFPLTEDQVSNFAFLGSPRYSYNLGATYTLPMGEYGDLVLSGKYFKISDIRYGSVIASPTEKTDFRLSWNNIVQSGVDVSAFVNNAFDSVGVAAPVGSTELGINSVTYSEPRMWGVQAQYKFGAK